MCTSLIRKCDCPILPCVHYQFLIITMIIIKNWKNSDKLYFINQFEFFVYKKPIIANETELWKCWKCWNVWMKIKKNLH